MHACVMGNGGVPPDIMNLGCLEREVKNAGKSYLRDQAHACWIDGLISYCCLLEAMSLTSSAMKK